MYIFMCYPAGRASAQENFATSLFAKTFFSKHKKGVCQVWLNLSKFWTTPAEKLNYKFLSLNWFQLHIFSPFFKGLLKRASLV